MCKICVFAGTTEGRELVEFLVNSRFPSRPVWQQSTVKPCFPMQKT